METMKLVKLEIELVIDDKKCGSYEDIAFYLNHKLYADPEFFGEFGKENIVAIEELV